MFLLKNKIMNTGKEKIPEHIQKQMMECVMKYSMEEKLSMFDAWKAKGCPSVEKVNKMIW